MWALFARLVAWHREIWAPVHSLRLAGFKYESFANSRFCKKMKMAEKKAFEISKHVMWKWRLSIFTSSVSVSSIKQLPYEWPLPVIFERAHYIIVIQLPWRMLLFGNLIHTHSNEMSLFYKVHIWDLCNLNLTLFFLTSALIFMLARTLLTAKWHTVLLKLFTFVQLPLFYCNKLECILQREKKNTHCFKLCIKIWNIKIWTALCIFIKFWWKLSPVGRQVPNELVYQGFVVVLIIRIGAKWAFSSVFGRCFIMRMRGSGN